MPASYGFNRCEIRIDSADSLPADDRYAFSVERTDPKKVLFVDDGRRPQAQEFFRAALNATPDSAFQLEALRPEVAATSDLSKYAVVVLNDLGSLPSGLEQSLQKYVTAGGSLFEAIGPASRWRFRACRFWMKPSTAPVTPAAKASDSFRFPMSTPVTT